MKSIILSLLLCSVASAQWSKGFNFRATSGTVSDAAGEARITDADTYPTTVLSTSVGWTVAPTSCVTRSVSEDRRLTGICYMSDLSGSAIFRVNLPATGTYYVWLALGDVTDPQTGQYLQVLDDTTPVLTISSSGGTATGHYIDATATDYSKAAWPGSNSYATLTFATTTMYIKLGSSSLSGYSTLAHFKIADYIPSGGGGGGGGTVATTNKITINNTTGSTVNQPYQISRVFKRGELANYPKPSGFTEWQSVVKTRWPDGSVQHAIISFWRSTATDTADEILFVNSTDACHLGNEATCEAAGLDGAGMLAFNGGAWGAGINTTAAGVGGSVTSSARTMLTAGKFTYWIRGPIETVAIIEDRTSARSYDYGYTCSTNCPGTPADYSTATWTTDSTYKSLHPMFIATFFPSWAGVYVEAIMQNGWTTAIQDQAYSVTILKDSALGTTVKSSTFVSQIAMSEWVYRFWDGTATTLIMPSSDVIFTDGAPTTFSIDMNLPYIIASKIIPNHDQTVNVAAYVDTEYEDEFITNLNGSEPFFNPLGTTRIGSMISSIATTGGRGDLGLNPRWYMRYLYSFDPRLYMVLMGNGDLAGTAPYHLWESDTGRFYDSAGTVDAFGKPLSLDARPTFRIGYYPDLSKTGTVLADQAQPVGDLNAPTGWVPEYNKTSTAHQANYSFLPYLLTGDYFYLMDYQSINGVYLSRGVPGILNNQRHESWGITSYENDLQTRGVGWGLRSLGDITFMSPDSTPEKAYFAEKLENNLAAMEAYAGITDGHYAASCDATNFNPATETNKYCWALYGSGGWPNPLHIPLCRNCHPGSTSPDGASDDAVWQASIMLMSFGHLAELGFNADVLVRETSALHRGLALSTLGQRAGWAKYTLEAPYIAVTAASESTTTTLASGINSSTLTITVAAAQPWMDSANLPFYADIDAERVFITGISGTTLTVGTYGRGTHGTTATSHSTGATVGPQLVAGTNWVGPWAKTVDQIYGLIADPIPNETWVSTVQGGCYSHSTEWAGMLAGTQPACWYSAADPEFGHGNMGLSALSFGGDYSAWQAVYDSQHADPTFIGVFGNPKILIVPRSTPLPSTYFRGLIRTRGGVSAR